jgi:hypothetical protein
MGKTIVRARLKPYGGTSEFVTAPGRIKSMINLNPEDNYDFVIDESGRKRSIAFGVDYINPDLVGQTIPVTNKFSLRFDEEGGVTVIEGDDLVKESLPRESSVKQLERIRKISKGIDIGDRIPKLTNQGNNIQYDYNVIDNKIESWEEFNKKNQSFIPGWNVKKLISPFGK